MNILLAADVSIKDVIGGAERALYLQSAFLAQKGHRVYVLTRMLPSHTTNHEVINQVHEYRYPVNAITHAQKLYEQVSSGTKFDVINFHQPFTAFALNILKETTGIKKVYTCHSLAFEEYASRNPKQNPLAKAFNMLLRKWMEKYSLDRSDKIVVLSQYTQDKLLRHHGVPKHKIIQIPGAVDVNLFKPAVDKIALRTELNIPTTPLILFTARNLVQRMGLENLIKTIPLLQHKGVDVKLYVGGQGILKEQLAALIEELGLKGAVHLCGFLSQEDLVRYYQMADFFILPSVDLEGFGLVTIEAMACGTPALATPIGGSIEILRSFDKNFLFKNTSPEAMAELIFEKYTYYKNGPDEYKKLSLAARTYVTQNYSLEKNLECIETLFKGLL